MFPSNPPLSHVRWIGVLLATVTFATADSPPRFVDQSNDIPDFCQTDPAGRFPKNGGDFCGPVAVANSLVYLAKKDFPRMLPAARDTKDAQILMIRRLASSGFMDTVEKNGTSPPRLMAGIEKYIEQCGCRITRLEHQGWRETTRQFPRQAEIPSMDWIKQGLSDPGGAVWLNVGWYKKDTVTDTYTRFGGHWVTLVGYGKDQNGREDPWAFLIHDPAPRTGTKFRTQHVKMVPIDNGGLQRTISQNQIRHRDARGFLEMKDGMVLKRGADAAILDAVVVLAVGLNPPGH